MKHGFYRFSFIAISALSLVLGIPGQARALDSESCSATHPYHYHTVVGGPNGTFDKREAYWSLAKKYYGQADEAHVDVIHAATGIDPRHLHRGDVIVIPCIDRKWQVAIDKAFHKGSAPVRAFVPPQSKKVEVSMITLRPPVIPVAFEMDIPEVPAVSLPALPPPPPSIAINQPPSRELNPLAVHAPIPAKAAPAGWYEIELAPNQVRGIANGQFPALLVADQNRKGFWEKRRKTAVDIRMSNGNFTVTMDFRHIPPSAHSEVIVDLGGGNLVRISGEVVARDGKVGPARPLKHFHGRDYAMLDRTFVKKSPVMVSALRRTLPVAIPAAVGFGAAGPIGAAFGGGIPFARNFIMAKVMRSQTPPQEAVAPHIQTVLADQDDRISALEGQMARLQKQLAAALKVSAEGKGRK